jgi:hypothetical protein
MASTYKATFLIFLILSREVSLRRVHDKLSSDEISDDQDFGVAAVNQSKSEFAVMTIFAVVGIAWGVYNLYNKAVDYRNRQQVKRMYRHKIQEFLQTVAQPCPNNPDYTDRVKVEIHMLILVQLYSMCGAHQRLRAFVEPLFTHVANKYQGTCGLKNIHRWTAPDMEVSVEVMQIVYFAEQVTLRMCRHLRPTTGLAVVDISLAVVDVAAYTWRGEFTRDVRTQANREKNRGRFRKAAKVLGAVISVVAVVLDPSGLSLVNLVVSGANALGEAAQEKQFEREWKRTDRNNPGYCVQAATYWQQYIRKRTGFESMHVEQSLNYLLADGRSPFISGPRTRTPYTRPNAHSQFRPVTDRRHVQQTLPGLLAPGSGFTPRARARTDYAYP